MNSKCEKKNPAYCLAKCNEGRCSGLDAIAGQFKIRFGESDSRTCIQQL